MNNEQIYRGLQATVETRILMSEGVDPYTACEEASEKYGIAAEANNCPICNLMHCNCIGCPFMLIFNKACDYFASKKDHKLDYYNLHNHVVGIGIALYLQDAWEQDYL